MSCRLQKDESLADRFKRIAGELITGAIEELQSHNVYEVRKRIKKLRAILRLLKPQLGAIYVEENRRLRDIARCFSSARDLDVSLEVLETFAIAYKRGNTLDPHRRHLSRKRAAVEQQQPDDVSRSCESLIAIRHRIDDWPLSHLSQASLDSRLESTRKHSRRAFHKAQHTRRPEDLHELRKFVKHELNQRRLFPSAGAQSEELKKLSTLLGDHHNLVVLMANLETPSARFHRLTQTRLRNYETQILSLAESVYQNHHATAVA